MDQLFYIIASTVQAFISALMLMLLFRSLLGLFADEESKVFIFCSVVTEPVVHPVRSFLSKIPALEDSPIDFSYMATYLVLIIVQYALPV